MTDAISQYAQLAKLERFTPKDGDKAAKADASLAAGETVAASLAGSKAVVVAPAASGSHAAEELNMSKMVERVKQEPDFDKAKVDAIKESIKNGQYPLNVKRMAESFMAIEQLIGK